MKISIASVFALANLESITIPSSVTLIGASAFSRCSSLTTITMENTIPPSAGSEFFNSCSALTAIYVKNYLAMIEYNRAGGWSDYASLIKVKES